MERVTAHAVVSFVALWLAACAAPAPVSGMTLPAGYGGERGLIRFAPERVLFSSGRIGSGEGAAMGERQTDRVLTRVVRTADGWLACGLDQIGKGYFSRGLGHPYCLVLDNAGTVRFETQADGPADQPLDLIPDGPDAVLTLARDALDGLKVHRLSAQGAQVWSLPGGAEVLTGAITGPREVSGLYKTDDGCEWRRFAREDRGALRPVSALPADSFLCQGELRVVREADGPGLWIHAWRSDDGALYAVEDGSLRDTAMLALAAEGGRPGAVTALNGIIYFDAGRTRERGDRIGAYDTRTRNLSVRDARRAPGLEGPPDVVGLMPSADGRLFVLLRKGPWATYDFTSNEPGEPTQ